MKSNKKLYTLKENGMKLIEAIHKGNETLLVICNETDEFCILKKVEKIPAFGMTYKGKIYVAEHVFSLSNVFSTLQDLVE